MMLLLLSFLAVTLAYPQTREEANFINLLDKPPTTTRPSNLPPRLEDITVSPTVSNAVHKDSNGDQCQCVPYLCDGNLKIGHINNASITCYIRMMLYRMLDIRLAKEDCQESVERCCKNPKPYVEPTTTTTTIKPTINKGCGFRNPHGIDFSITGGGFQFQLQFPWVVALLDSGNGSNLGVGALIHPQVVMTGAHIVFKYPPKTLLARAGECDTQTTKERLKSQERLVKDLVIRDDFNPTNLENDIALLRLQQPVDLAEHINVICLPDQGEDFDHIRNCVANGWGKGVFGQSRYAVIFKKVEVDVVPFERCDHQLKRTRLWPWLNFQNSFMCAGGEEGKDTCQGDGGAPLACPIGSDRYKLAGLVSWRLGCGVKDVPGVNTRVSMFKDWIDNNMLAWGFETDVYTIN